LVGWMLMRPNQKVSRMILWKLRYCTYRDWRLMLFKVGSFSTYTHVPPFLSMLEAPLRFRVLELPVTAPVHCVHLFPHQQIFCIYRFFEVQWTEKVRGSRIWWVGCLTCEILCLVRN
jgi:hypothetical protein